MGREQENKVWRMILGRWGGREKKERNIYVEPRGEREPVVGRAVFGEVLSR